MSKKQVGAAMMNWRYVGKTFRYRDEMKKKICKQGPDHTPAKFIEKGDVVYWKGYKHPKNVQRDTTKVLPEFMGQVYWLDTVKKQAKVRGVNVKITELTVHEQRMQGAHMKKEDVPRYNASEQSIPLRDLTLLDLKGNPVEKVTMGYLKKDGEPVRLSENMVVIPYPDVEAPPKAGGSSASSQGDLDSYPKYIASVERADVSILEKKAEHLELETVRSKKGYLKKVKTFVTKEEEVTEYKVKGDSSEIKRK